MLPRMPGRPIGVGVQLPEVEREVRWREVRDMARAAEDTGLDSVWLGDHLLYRYANGSTRGPWEAWTQLAGIAAVTQRVLIGPLVAAVGFHAPAMLAKMAAGVDEISGGRLVVGLGAGWNETDFRAFGFPFDHRVSRFEEAFTIIRTLLRGGRIDFDGRFYQARDCELLPRPARAGGPPLLIGSSRPRMLEITLPHVDAWNAWFADTRNSPDGAQQLVVSVDEACAAVGRPPREVERTVAILVQLPGGTGRMMGETSPRQAVPPLTGSPQAMAAELRRYADAGIGHVQLVLDPITRTSIEAIGPVVRALDG